MFFCLILANFRYRICDVTNDVTDHTTRQRDVIGWNNFVSWILCWWCCKTVQQTL